MVRVTEIIQYFESNRKSFNSMRFNRTEYGAIVEQIVINGE